MLPNLPRSSASSRDKTARDQEAKGITTRPHPTPVNFWKMAGLSAMGIFDSSIFDPASDVRAVHMAVHAIERNAPDDRLNLVNLVMGVIMRLRDYGDVELVNP